MSRPTVLVIQHEDDAPPAWYGEWLAAAGVDLHVCRPDRGEPVPENLQGYAGLLVLGGEMGANDDAVTPWLTPTKRLITDAVDADQPVLGICLGHQLAAVALGGTAEPNPHGPAKGLTPVRLTPAGAEDPLLGAGTVRDGSQSVQWNNDVVTVLPDGATELATAPDGTVQAARYSTYAWGVQFHPEASPAVFRSWTADKPGARRYREDGTDVLAAAKAVDAAEQDLRTAWRPLAERFAWVVRTSPTDAGGASGAGGAGR